MMQPSTEPNAPALAGTRASQVVTFGPESRYGVYAVHTRFDRVAWVVRDAILADEDGPAMIRLSYDFEQAVRGLPEE